MDFSPPPLNGAVQLSTPFSQTLPRQGTMRNGVLYEHVTQDFPIAANAFSSSRGSALLPTPNTFDGNRPKSRVQRHHHKYTERKGSDANLREIVLYDWNAERVKLVDEYARRVPPPAKLMEGHHYSDGKWYDGTKPIPWEVVNGEELPSDETYYDNNGKPLPWERVKGEELLSAKFTEWIMGLPDGWVTDVPGLTRTGMFSLLGNGVAPPQMVLGLRSILPSPAPTG